MDYLVVSVLVWIAMTLRFGTRNFALGVPEEEQYNNPLIV